jgi:hypothetical protein
VQITSQSKPIQFTSSPDVNSKIGKNLDKIDFEDERQLRYSTGMLRKGFYIPLHMDQAGARSDHQRERSSTQDAGMHGCIHEWESHTNHENNKSI